MIRSLFPSLDGVRYYLLTFLIQISLVPRQNLELQALRKRRDPVAVLGMSSWPPWERS